MTAYMACVLIQSITRIINKGIYNSLIKTLSIVWYLIFPLFLSVFLYILKNVSSLLETVNDWTVKPISYSFYVQVLDEFTWRITLRLRQAVKKKKKATWTKSSVKSGFFLKTDINQINWLLKKIWLTLIHILYIKFVLITILLITKCSTILNLQKFILKDSCWYLFSILEFHIVSF